MATANDVLDRLANLEQQVQRILERLDALSGRTSPGSVPARAIIAERQPGEAHPEEGGFRGSLTYSGSVRFGQRRLKFQQQMDLSTFLDAEPEAVSRVFAAFGSPFRILLLRVLLQGPRTSRQLHEVLQGTSIGLLYHHLRDLVASGLVVQPKRNVYAIPPKNMMSICLAFVAASHLLTVGPGAEESDAMETEDEVSRDPEP